jgi:hypothetical protein
MKFIILLCVLETAEMRPGGGIKKALRFTLRLSSVYRPMQRVVFDIQR